MRHEEYSGISWDMKNVATLKAIEYEFLPADRVKIDIIAMM